MKIKKPKSAFKSSKTKSLQRATKPVEVSNVTLSNLVLRDFFKKKVIESALAKILKSSKAHMLSVWARDEVTNRIEFITGAGKHKKEQVKKLDNFL